MQIYRMFRNFIKYVGNNFGNPAGIGGKIATAIMNIINQKQYKAVIKNIKLEENNRILDIGFGNGYLIKKLFETNTLVKIYGIEISNDMLRNVSLKNSPYIEKGLLNLSLASISKTAFENNMFDRIYTVNTIYFWNELDKCFSEIKRILKPGGMFINVIYTKNYLDKIVYTKYGFQKYTIEEIQNLTEKNGMTITETIEIQKDKSYCVISEVKIP